MIHCRKRVLPDQGLGRNFRPHVSCQRTHVTMGQLEPGTRKGILEFLGVVEKTARNLAIARIFAKREIGSEHDRSVALACIERIRNEVRGLAVRGNPLDRARRRPRLHPFVRIEVLQVLHGPARGRRRPRALEARGDGVGTAALAAAVHPAKALLLDVGSGRFGPGTAIRRARSMRLAKGMAARNERYRFFVIHGHAAEGLADVARCGEGVGDTIRPLRIHVDQAHLHGRKRLIEITLAAVALVGKELVLGSPVNKIGFPVVLASACKTEGLEAHRLERDITCEHHEIGPGQSAPILLLDRPKQTPSLVQIRVVGPAVERLEALLTTCGTATAVRDAIDPGAVPCHANEERTVMAVVRRPPRLGVGHQCLDVGLHGIEIQGGERLGVIDLGAERIGVRAVLAQRSEIESLRPPELVVLGAVRSSSDARGGRSEQHSGKQWKNRASHGVSPCEGWETTWRGCRLRAHQRQSFGAIVTINTLDVRERAAPGRARR